MKVRMVGLEVQVPEAIPRDDFEAKLGGAPSGIFASAGHDRLFRARVNNGHVEGLLLTLKSQKSIPLISTGTLEVSVHEIERGKQMVDFNFFRWNSATGRGLFLTYYQAPGLGALEHVLDAEYAKLKAERVEAECRPLSSDREKQRVRGRYRGGLKVARLASMESLDSLLDELSSVDELQVVGVGQLEGSEMAPLTPYVQRRAVTIRFKSDRRESSAIKTALKRVARALPGYRGRIRGKVDGRERTLNFDTNYDSFGEEDFDSAAQAVMMRLSDWHSSPLLTRLREAMSDQGAIFTEREA